MATPTLTFPCPFCGRRMGVGLELLGKHVRCPHCKQVVLAPAAPATAQPKAAPAPTKPFGAHENPTPVSPPPAPHAPLLPPPAAIAPPAPRPAESPPEPAYTFPQKEAADSILSDATESEDEVFGSHPGNKLPTPMLPELPPALREPVKPPAPPPSAPADPPVG